MKQMKKNRIISAILSILMIASMVIGMIPPISVEVDAATNCSSTDAVNWAQSKLGKALDYDGVSGAQCVDLIKYYYVFLGKTAVRGNGKDYASNALPSGWERIKAGSGLTPQPGDIAVWTTGGKGYGHVAIVVSSNGSTMNVIEQNWGHKYVTSRSNVAISGIWGVVRPDFSNTQAPTYANLSIPKNSFRVGEQFTLSLSSDTSCQYYISIFDENTGERILGENASTTYQNTFWRAGHYSAYMSAYNSSGSVDSNWIDFCVWGDPPSLSVSIGSSITKTTFYWSETAGALSYDLKIWRDKLWEGDPYHVEWNTRSGCSLQLPPGTYVAYVDAANKNRLLMGNTVTFTVYAHECSYSTSIISPTCTAEGYTTYTCSACGHSYNGNYKSALGHKYYSYQVYDRPTTSYDGSIYGRCSRCSDVTFITLPYLNTGDYSYSVVSDPTYTSTGTGRYTWKNTSYGTFYFDVTIPQLNNVFSYVIAHWACGFKNSEGTNAAKTSVNLRYDTYESVYNSQYILDSNKALSRIPNGFSLHESFGTLSISGTWQNYPLGTTVTQTPETMYFEYSYLPIDYTITYNLNGGTNSSANPSTYNVLYGVTLAAPTKDGYLFKGWVDESGNPITGINKGLNADFASTADYNTFCNVLSKRTTGNRVLTAVWELSGKCGDNLTWVLHDNGELVISGTGDMWKWTSHDQPWDSYRTEIKTVTICDGVSNIGNNAFKGCTNITSIVIPKSVSSIGQYAFAHCFKLTSITIPDSVVSLQYGAFYDCIRLANITIPDSITAIEMQTFQKCLALTSITIPDSVKTIGNTAFYNCTGLESITFGNSVTTIGESAFANCTSLTSIALPDSVMSLDSGAFAHCEKLTDITFGNGVKSIGSYAFSNCISLTNVVLGNNVATIGEKAFGYCTNLTSITIPASVTEINTSAFTNCESLSRILIDEGNREYSADENCVIFNRDKTVLIDYPASKKDSTYVIPSSVTSIGNGAFASCHNLINITIPDCVTSIGSYAFSNCSKLTNLVIPSSVESIGDYAFQECFSLQSLTVLSRDVKLGSRLFFISAGKHIIYGYAGSTIEAYAIESRSNFVTLEEPSLSSDINGDGALDIKDAIALFRYNMMPNFYPISYEGDPDFTKDGYKDITDVIHLFRHIMLPGMYPL